MHPSTGSNVGCIRQLHAQEHLMQVVRKRAKAQVTLRLSSSGLKSPAAARLRDNNTSPHHTFESNGSQQQQPSEPARLWRDLYKELESVQMVGYGWYDRKTTVICTAQMTLYGAVFASASRVRLAKQSLNCNAEHYRSAAGRCADAEALAAAHELGMPYTAATMHRCALCNKLAVMQFLHAQGCPWDESVCTAAAERGCFEMLRWAREHGCEWEHQHILQAAASSGNIEMTAWVKSQPNVGLGPQAMYSAAANGHTAMCAYLRAEGSPWHKLACCAAAEGAHCDTLRWLHEHGCPWIPNGVYLSAAKGGSISALSYLQQEGIEYTAERLTAMLLRAGAHSKLAAAQWLRQQGAAWPDLLNVDNVEWSGDVLDWARAEGCTAPTF
eukprot:1886-Heterococcus_DN1.PRE.2